MTSAASSDSSLTRTPLRTRWREAASQSATRSIGIGLFLVLVVAYFWITTANFFTWGNGANILNEAGVLGIVAIGQSFAIISGGFDLSVAGTVPLACVLYVYLSNHGWPVWEAYLGTLVVGALVGLLNTFFITYVKINPLITTLATMSIAGGLAFTVAQGTTLPLNDFGAGDIANGVVGNISYFAFVWVALVLLSAFVLRRTIYGRMVYAVGGSAEASRLAGIRVGLISGSVYLLSGVMAALGGIIIASQILAGSANVGSTEALQSVAAVVLGGAALSGGTGGTWGTVSGVLVLGCLANGMAIANVQAFYQQIATGAVLLLAVAFGQLRRRLESRSTYSRARRSLGEIDRGFSEGIVPEETTKA